MMLVSMIIKIGDVVDDGDDVDYADVMMCRVMISLVMTALTCVDCRW